MQTIANDNNVVLLYRAGAVLNFVAQFSRFKNDDFEVIWTVQRNATTSVQDEKADIDRVRRAERPDVELFTIDLPINEGVGSFPR